MPVPFVRVLSLSALFVCASCERTTAPAEGGPAPAASPESAPAAGLPDRDPALAHRLVEQEGAILLDVRSEEEFAEGHIENAHNIPHDQVPDRLDEIEQLLGGDKSTPIVVYCRSGHRAGIAKESLVGSGFSAVTNLGGKDDW